MSEEEYVIQHHEWINRKGGPRAARAAKKTQQQVSQILGYPGPNF